MKKPDKWVPLANGGWQCLRCGISTTIPTSKPPPTNAHPCSGDANNLDIIRKLFAWEVEQFVDQITLLLQRTAANSGKTQATTDKGDA